MTCCPPNSTPPVIVETDVGFRCALLKQLQCICKSLTDGFAFELTESPIVVTDSSSLNLTVSGPTSHNLTGNVIIDSVTGGGDNLLTVGVNGLYVPPASSQTPLNVTDSNSIDFTASGPFNTNLTGSVRLDSFTGSGNNILSIGVNGLYAPPTTSPPINATNTFSILLSASGVSNHDLAANLKVDTSPGNILVVSSDGVYVPSTPSIPSLGDPGQVLAKNSYASYDVGWYTPSEMRIGGLILPDIGPTPAVPSSILYVGGGEKLKQAPNLFVFNDNTLSLGIGTNLTGDAHIAVKIYDLNYKGMTIQGAVGQFDDYIQWKKSDGTVLGCVNFLGWLAVGKAIPSHAVHAQADSSFPLGVISTTPATSGALSLGLFKSISSNDMIDGFGGSISFFIEDNSGVLNNFTGSLGFVRAGGDTTSRFELVTNNNNAPILALTIASTGLHTTTRRTTSTNVAIESLKNRIESSGDMADGFGPITSYVIYDNAFVDNTIGSFGMVRSGADNSGAFVFVPYSAGVGTERMRLSPAGFLGIGTTNPTVRLHVELDSNADSYLAIFKNINATGGCIVQIDKGADVGNTRAVGINLTQSNTTKWFIGNPRRGGSSNSTLFTVSTTTDINGAGGEFLLNPSGNCCIGGGFALNDLARLAVVGSNVAKTTLLARAAAAQTANLFEAQNSSGTAYVKIGPPTLTGLSYDTNFLTVSGTMPASPIAGYAGVYFNITPAGSHTGSQEALSVTLNAGFTGNASTSGISTGNSTAGTVKDLPNFGGNRGVRASATATTAGANYGVVGFSHSGDLSVGVAGYAGWIAHKASSVYIGVVGYGSNTDGTSKQLGGYFTLAPVAAGSTPTFTSAALMCDNSATVDPIFVARDNGTNVFTIGDGGKITIDNTITPGGTTGARTINKASGTVNFAAGATTLVVTNSLCTTSSIVMAVVRTGDATAYIKNVIPIGGSFTITLGAAATAETSVGFMIIN